MIAFKLGCNKNELYKTLDYWYYWSGDMLNFDFSEKGLEIVSPPHFVYDFSTKNVSHVIFDHFTKFNYLIAFTSWDIRQYVYCNCLLTRLWHHKFQNWPDIFNQAVFLPKSQDKILNIWEQKELLRWNKKHFSLLLKTFQLPKFVSDLRVRI